MLQNRINTMTILIFLISVLPLKAQQVITPDEIVSIGLQNNYGIRIARNVSEIADNNKGLGRAGLLPVISGTGNYTLSSSSQTTNSPFSFGDSDTRSYGAQINMNWTLFDGFRMFIDRRRYIELAILGEIQARITIENNVIMILNSYYDLIQKKQLLDIARASRDVSEERLNRERARNEIGGTSTTDLLNAQVSFNNDVSALLDRELELDIAYKDLNILLGKEPDFMFLPVDDIELEIEEPDLNAVMRLAEEKYTPYIAVIKDLVLAEQDVRYSKSQYFPNISLNANLGYTDRTVSSGRYDGDIETQSSDNSIFLSVTYDLFDGFRRRTALQNAKIDLKNRELAHQDELNRLKGLVREKFMNFYKATEKVRLEQQNIQAARQNLTLQQERFQLGSANSIEFRDSQINYNRAQSSLINAKYLAKTAQIELNRLKGEIRIK